MAAGVKSEFKFSSDTIHILTRHLLNGLEMKYSDESIEFCFLATEGSLMKKVIFYVDFCSMILL